MNILEIKNASTIEALLEQFTVENPEELGFAIEALKSLTNTNEIHTIDDSLKDRIQDVQMLIKEPPNKGSSEQILEKVVTKIKELSSNTLKIEKKLVVKIEEIVIPSFTNEMEVNQIIHKALLELRKYELKQLKSEEGSLQLYTPLEGRSDFNSSDRFDAFTQVSKFLTNKNEQCLLLTGDAGAGKTTFAYFLAASLWNEHEKGILKDKLIPVVIPLITIGNGDLEKKLIETHLGNRGLSAKEILLLKEHVSFVFILEGYDERDVFKNLYKTNDLDKWNCKVITGCRSQALLNRQENYRTYFTTSLLDHKLNEVILCPFTEKEIKKYIHHFVEQHKKEIEWKEERYWETLSQLPSVLDLVSNPFVLSMTLLTLPEIVKKYDWKVSSSEKELEILIDEKELVIEKELVDEKKLITENELIEEKKIKEETPTYDKMSFTQAELYDGFIDAWFDRQLKKLDKESKLELTDGTLLTKEDFLKFNQGIATEMLKHKTKFLEVQEGKVKKESSLISGNSTSVSHQEENWQLSFLNTQDEKTTLLRSGWLLKKVGERTYTFLHDSLRAYFAAKQLFQGILSRSSFALGHPLNEQLIVDKPDLLSSLVDRVKKDPTLEKILFELLETSKHEPFVATGAANAITLLNQAGIYFLGQNLSRVRIQGANLSGAFLSGANFTEADLRDVNFVEASLVDVNLTGACMEGVQFGQRPLLQCQNKVYSCSYSSDGKWLAVGDDKGYIYLYEADKGLLVDTLKNWSFGQINSNCINSLCFSPDNQFLGVGSDDGFCRIWNVSSAKLWCTLKVHTFRVTSVNFSHDGKTVASGSYDKPFRLWEVSSGKELAIFKGHTFSVYSISFSPDGKTLASGSADETVRLWDVSSGEKLGIFKGHTGNVTSVSFSPDGKTLASGSWDKTVRLWEFSSGKELAILKGHTEYVNTVSFSPDGKILASGSNDKTVRLWDVSSGRELAIREGHTDYVKSVSFSPDGKILASGSGDKTVRLWEVSFINALRKTERYTSAVNSVSFSPDGKIIACVSKDNTVRLLEVSSGKELAILKEHNLNTVSFSPDGKTLASGGLDKTIRLWDVSSGKEHAIFNGYTFLLSNVTFSSDGKTLASGGWKTVELWDVSSGEKLGIFEGHIGNVTSVSFSPDGKTLASGSWDNTVRLWEVSSRKELAILKGHTVSFSPDGKTLASGSLDHTVRLWEISSGKELTILKGHISSVNSVSFSPDAKIVVSGSEDKTVRLWEVSSGKCLHVVFGFVSSVKSVAWDSTGQWLVAGDDSGAIKRFRIPKELNKNPPLLFWSSHGTQGLHCENTTITQVTGLSSNNLKLLQQHSSIGQVSQKSSEDILFARDQMETVGDSCETVFGRLYDNGDLLGLTPKNWVVSLAHKKKNEHAFLILEGIENEKRVIYQAEVFLDCKQKTNEYHIPLYGKLGFGYAYVQIKPMTASDAEELAKQCHFRSEPITKDQANKLFELIYEAANNKELQYNNLGNSKLYAIALGNKEYGNCLTFAEKWLKETKVKFVEESGWEKTLSPFDITSKRSYFLSNQKNNKSSCLLQ